jgi:hypothetical protein
MATYREAILAGFDEARDRKVYATEAEAAAVAEEISDRWVDSDGDAGYRAAVYSVSRGGWRIVRCPFIPGTCT